MLLENIFKLNVWDEIVKYDNVSYQLLLLHSHCCSSAISYVFSKTKKVSIDLHRYSGICMMCRWYIAGDM